MGSGGLAALGVGIVIVLAVGVALAGGFVGGSVETSVSEFQLPDPPSDGTRGIVTERRAEGGTSFLGWQFSKPEHSVNVWVLAPADCVWLDGDVESLRSTGECADVPAVGPIVGSGRTSEAENLYLVRVAVTEDCLDAIEVGDFWPPLIPECA